MDTTYTKKKIDNDFPKDPPNPTSTSLHFKLSFALLCLINLVCAIDATILAVALPVSLPSPIPHPLTRPRTIATSLHGTAILAFWTGTSFLLTSTIFVPIWISLSHLTSRLPILLSTITFFFLGSLICSLSPNFTILLLGRSIQGIGGGGISALTNVIISDMFSLRERGKWMGLIALMWCLGAVVGPLLGGGLAQRNWRWIFYINFLFCGVTLVGFPFVLRSKKKVGGGGWKSLMREFDWVGSVLFIGGLTGFLIPVSWGGVTYPWTDWHTLLPLLLGIMGLLSFIEYSRVYSTHPLIRGSIFSTSTGTINFICTSIHGIILWSLLYYMPLYYEVAKNLSPVMSGVALFPFTLTMGPSSVIVSIIIALTGRYRPSLWLGWILTLFGTLLLLPVSAGTPIGLLIVLQLTPGIGFGILYPALSLAIQAPFSDNDLAFASAMFTFFRTLGQSLGLALSGTIFQNSLKSFISKSSVLGPMGKAEEWAKDASSLVGVIKGMEEGMVKKELVKAYCGALRVVLCGMCALAGVAMVASLVGTKGLSLDRGGGGEWEEYKGKGDEEGRKSGETCGSGKIV